MPDLVLKVDGQLLTGWTSLELVRSLEAVSGAFRLSGSDREGFPVPEGAAVELILEGTPFLTGWADTVSPDFAPRLRRVSITGRDRTADLVDCSPLDSEVEFEGLALDGLAAELARPFGIPVSVLADPGPAFERFAVQPGETVFDALERAARLRGVLLTTDGRGALVLERPGTGRAEVALVQGENVLAGSGTFNRAGRFRRYVVRGQRPGSDLAFGDELCAEAEAFDDAIRKSRGMLIVAEGPVDLEAAQLRAEWEASVRRARGSALQLIVQGWTQRPGGPIWTPNLVTRARVPFLRVDRELLIASVRFRLDPQSGTTAELELMHPDAFKPAPVLEVFSDLAVDLADPEAGFED